MKGGDKAGTSDVSRDAERIIEKLSQAGPQDVHQLSPDGKCPTETHKAIQLLVEKELVEEKPVFVANSDIDPFSKVYGLAKGAVILPTW